MFEGPIGKKMMIEQGYVPADCQLEASVAGPAVYLEVSRGRNPCLSCNMDRTKCSGPCLPEKP